MFKGQLRIEAMQTIPKTLYTEIAKTAVLDNIQSEFVSASTGINFAEISSDTNGKGVYTLNSTKDEKFPVHYYRGAVTNNNVKFGGFCWKIVRTTETGGIKLIYNGSPDLNGQCTGENVLIGTSVFNTDYTDLKYIGYMLDNESDSAIKEVIDTWYQNNMTDYTKKLEDAIWCNDRSFRDFGNNTFFGAYDRIVVTTHQPSLDCVNDADKFTVSATNGNGLLTYPVAALTADEVVLAGEKTDNSDDDVNFNYYLNTNSFWWTLSPAYVNNFGTRGPLIFSSNFLDRGDYVDSSNGVRPAIVLAPGTKITSGNGSMNHPFEV